MARVGRRRGPNWVWPLILALMLVGLALLALAFLTPQTEEQQATEEPAATATEKPNDKVTIRDITNDPARYYGEDVTVDGRVVRLVGDQGLYVADKDGGSELLAVLDEKVSDTDLRNDDAGRFSGTIREVTGEELDRIEDSVDKPTRDALANEKAYLSVGDFEETSD